MPNSAESSYRFVRVDEFTPNSGSPWTSFGNVASVTQDPGNGAAFTFQGEPFPATGHAPFARLYLLGPSIFRVRFDPMNIDGDYRQDGSYAVVGNSFGNLAFRVLQNDAERLSIQLGPDVRVDVLLRPFAVQVFFRGSLISADYAQGPVYLPGVAGARAVANFKQYPANANYFGFGEKGGPTLAMNGQSMTFFNYDNYRYSGGTGTDSSGYKAVVPGFSNPGPLNVAEPLYNSIPLLIEDNPNPLDDEGHPTGIPYAYGLFLDNESQTYFNTGQSSSYAGNMYGKYYFGALYGELDYYVMVGPDTGAVLDLYTRLTGRPSLAPMWALGYHQGCYGYFDQATVLAAASAYRLARIPLDGMHIDVDFQDNYRTFTASPRKFPGGGKPAFDALHAMGVKASVNITGIVSLVASDETGALARYDVLEDGKRLDVFYKDVRVEEPAPAAPGYLVVNENYGTNIDRKNPYQPLGSQLGTWGHYADLGKLPVRTWWGDQYAPLLQAGLDMVWQDMTDPATQASVSDPMPWKTLPLNLSVYDFTTDAAVSHAEVHNVFALNLISATHEGLTRHRQTDGTNLRPFIIARGGYAGVQRYAASWTGDSASSWAFLRILIPEVLNFGLSGQPMAGADVGGFATSVYGDPDGATWFTGNTTQPDLLVRWTTASAFLGWFRNHYDGYNKAYQEPHRYGEPFASICRKYINVRYKLLQYFYDCLYECTQTGLPICRPMFLTDRGDPQVYSSPRANDQFLVGRDILVAPVVERDQEHRDVYLPTGSDWFAFTDNQAPLSGPSPGGQSVNWYVPLDLVPVYIRAGSIIPHRELEQYVGELAENPLTFDVYPGPDSEHILYQDDGLTTHAQVNGVCRRTRLSHSQSFVGDRRTQTLRVQREVDGFAPVAGYYFVAMLKSGAPLEVQVDGAAVPLIDAGSDEASSKALYTASANAAYYNASLDTTFVKVIDKKANIAIEGRF